MSTLPTSPSPRGASPIICGTTSDKEGRRGLSSAARARPVRGDWRSLRRVRWRAPQSRSRRTCRHHAFDRLRRHGDRRVDPQRSVAKLYDDHARRKHREHEANVRAFCGPDVVTKGLQEAGCYLHDHITANRGEDAERRNVAMTPRAPALRTVHSADRLPLRSRIASQAAIQVIPKQIRFGIAQVVQLPDDGRGSVFPRSPAAGYRLQAACSVATSTIQVMPNRSVSIP